MPKKAVMSALLVLTTLFSSCVSPDKLYLIGVSQCSEDSWRSKLQAELEQAT